jgi:hypothetical protein
MDVFYSIVVRTHGTGISRPVGGYHGWKNIIRYAANVNVFLKPLILNQNGK